jgi:hypothetical protein
MHIINTKQKIRSLRPWIYVKEWPEDGFSSCEINTQPTKKQKQKAAI